jgi:aerobic carbon-monoxide dehydrogenase large subunit
MSRLVGEPVRRVEDAAILRGEARFLDDVHVENPLWAAIVRSVYPHALIRGIDRDAAAAARGVVGAVTAGDLGAHNGPFPHPTWFPASERLQQLINPLMRAEEIRVLASERVRYVGEPVAAVMASTAPGACDAAELVEVDYEPLEVVADIETALARGAPLLNDAWGSNVSTRFTVGHGDVEGAFAGADVVVSETFQLARQTGAPIEPRGVLAVPEGGGLTVWSSTPSPHRLRDALTACLGLTPERIRVVAPFVGGGFGTKSMVYPEELLVSWLALRLGQPVKWVETRSESFLGAVHSRDQRHQIELALTADGRILGVRDHYLVDVGASNVEGLVVPYNTASHLQGGYRIPALELSCTCVVTNKTPLSAYRGAGRPEAVFAMERILDLGARQIGLDPVELRRRNLVGVEEMPYQTGICYRDGTDLILDAGDLPQTLSVAVEKAGYADWRARQGTLAASGRYVGVGVATYVEGTGIGPAEVAEVWIDLAGRVVVAVALPSQGQGHSTTIGQICADALGIDLDQVTVVQGDTAVVPNGGGTIASRTAVVVGNAAAEAARDVAAELRCRAADILEATPDDLELISGRVAVKGAVNRSIPIADIVAANQAPISGHGKFVPPGVTFACGTHVAVVEVNPWTGSVEVLRYVVAHDCGRVINPLIVEGQVAGGVAQGIGEALFEELVYDDAGQLVTGSFMDYLLPRATDIPGIEVYHLETPSDKNPLGIKGVGEAGAIGPPAAIAGAIEDALASFGARVTRCPLIPWVVAGLVPETCLASTRPRPSTIRKPLSHGVHQR